MSQTAQDVIELLKASKQTLSKVATDVANLHAKIDALPNSAELEEIKQLSGELNEQLKNVDAATEDEAGAGTEGGGNTEQPQ